MTVLQTAFTLIEVEALINFYQIETCLLVFCNEEEVDGRTRVTMTRSGFYIN